MVQRFLVLGQLPELNLMPSEYMKEPEVLIEIPLNDLWEIEELIKEIRFAHNNNFSFQGKWQKLIHKVKPHVTTEEERNWIQRNMSLFDK